MKLGGKRIDGSANLPLVLLLVFLVVLWLAGGASRADVLGQAMVRAVATLLMVIAIVFGERPRIGAARPVLLMLVAAIALAVVQLVPLPPDVWQSLPGRDLLAQAPVLAGQPQPWRPISMVPGATVNALGSLFIPALVLLLMLQLGERGHRVVLAAIAGLAAAAMALGLVQLTGVHIELAISNNGPGEISGLFANRNHFALFLAIGCLILPVLALSGAPSPMREVICLTLLLLFLITALASGSRAGTILSVLATALGTLVMRRAVPFGRRGPSRGRRVAVGGAVLALALLVGLSVVFGRAESLTRILTLQAGADMRTIALPTVLDMVQKYFPVGIGFGSFDPVFRIHEPFALLAPDYFNRVHNDFLEVVLEGGLLGLLLLAVLVFWWAATSIRAWKCVTTDRSASPLPAVGSSILLLIGAASIVDYPIRTPMIMAIAVIGAVWLARAERAAAPALRSASDGL